MTHREIIEQLDEVRNLLTLDAVRSSSSDAPEEKQIGERRLMLAGFTLGSLRARLAAELGRQRETP